MHIATFTYIVKTVNLRFSNFVNLPFKYILINSFVLHGVKIINVIFCVGNVVIQIEI